LLDPYPNLPPETFYSRDVKLTRVKEVSSLPDFQNMPFGVQHSDHMLEINYRSKQWGIPHIKPFENLQIHPFNSALHYAVQCFEGMKAYKDNKNQIRCKFSIFFIIKFRFFKFVILFTFNLVTNLFN
jgi:hypothetical protein